MPAKLPKFSYPVPSNKNGHAFSTAEDLLSKLDGESSGQYLVGSQGMWHGGIHITDATIPWCALSTNSAAEQQYRREPYKGEQFIRCMADGEIVAYRVCKDYEITAIPWRDESLHFSTSFVLVKHYVQPGETDDSGLTFYTLYMNLAPFSAYAPQGGELDKKTGGSQRYYTSVDDVQAGRAAGTLVKDTSVTLSDNIITRSSDRRQFTEVTIAEETKNAAGTTLSAGAKVWTVSDQGSLKVESSVPVPSWWAKCTPAYGAQPAGRVSCTSRTDWAYYLSGDDVLARKSAGKVAAGFPLTYEPDNAAQQVARPVTVTAGAAPTDAVNTFSLVTLGRDVGKQKKGDRVWIVSDGDSLTPVAPTTSASTLVFGEVVKPATAMTINAGDSIGHMGFFQLPEENGKRSRYQVHIECFSMDDTLPTFLTNPKHAGEQAPAFLKYPKAAALFAKDAAGQMVDSTRKTLTQGIVTLSKVPVVEVDGRPTYYQIHRENGYLAASSVQKLSQYALGELGFVALDKASESFNLLDGVQHPDNIVKGILEQMYKAAQDETRTSHALNEYNYQRLLEQIDSNHDKNYSEQEYLQAVHNVSYRDRRYRIIAKHASEWYYGKDDPLWGTYLNTLTTDAPQWKTYTEAFIEKIKWMKSLPGMGPELWHMHPVVFLDALDCDDAMDLKWLTVPKGQLTFDAEGNDQDNSPWFSRKLHWPGGVSGVTIGRGYDLGQQSSAETDLRSVGIGEPLQSWLVGSSGLSSAAASTRLNSANDEIRTYNVTRKQQYNLFILAYQRLEDDVKRISQKPETIRAYHSNPNATAEQAWADIPDKIKEILADLRYRGDYTPGIRTHIQRLAYSGDITAFGGILSDRTYWTNVPQDRFNRRVSYYAN
ncbi:hypothetical protein [Yersinia kristensenii]|uniref:hypothetical protein n=1 Tax=Yersinia kristensenii TaxID=28152 RepID=UPI001FEA41CD|nr:hypothetical protein [Yersinia kristensenii]